MTEIVKEVVSFIITGKEGRLMKNSCNQWGHVLVRVFCINLAGWWGRNFLMKSRHPYLTIDHKQPWHKDFDCFIKWTAELDRMIDIGYDKYEFKKTINKEEIEWINKYVIDNYKSKLQVRWH